MTQDAAEALGLESAWRLAGTDGQGRDLAVTIGRDELTNAYPGVTVGRHPQLADRVLDEPSVSRRHFRLSRSAEGVTLEDLSSLNGTLLDGVLFGYATSANVGGWLSIADLFNDPIQYCTSSPNSWATSVASWSANSRAAATCSARPKSSA